jgi:hypothetical protein
MTIAQIGSLAARLQTLERVLADRLEETEAWLARRALLDDQQAVLCQQTERIDVRAAHVLGRGGRAATREDAQSPDVCLGRLRQQVVAPCDGVAHRPLASGQVARTAGQERQGTIQTREQVLGREHSRAGRRQLEG